MIFNGNCRSMIFRFRFRSFSKSTQSIDLRMKQLVDLHQYHDALELFDRQSTKLTDNALNLALKASTKLADRERGVRIHQQLSKHSLANPYIQTSLMHFYMQCREIDRAEQIFASIEKKTAVSYATLFKGYITNGMPEKVIASFEQMPVKADNVLMTILFNACARAATPTAVTLGNDLLTRLPPTFFENNHLATSAVDMLMKFGEVNQAERLWTQMKRRDSVSYAVLMNGYQSNGRPLLCLQLLEQMKKSPTTMTDSIAVPLVSACAQIGIVSICRRVLEHIHLKPQKYPRLRNVLIDMWGKSGDVDEAKCIFQLNSQVDVIAHTCMVNAYGRNGMGHEAIELYRRIPPEIRDNVAHLCVLNACSHSGFVEEGREIFDGIPTKTNKVVTTMVDCLSRLCLFDEAQQLITNYEQTNLPYPTMYMALLSGARNHRHSLLSQKIYDRMQNLFPCHRSDLIAASVLLSNTYASVGEHEQAGDVRNHRLKEFGMKTKVGLTWTEHQGQLLEFRAHDRSHPQSDEIYAEAERMANDLREAGHQFDSSWVTRPLQPDETIETVLCGHSEKLALAFHFIQRPRPRFIQLTKNLRICGDCHRATKLLAKIRKVVIVVRDANRIHRFDTDGTCSCRDHF